MKLVRYGRPGHEKPGLIDAEGHLRSLEGVIGDFTPENLSEKTLTRLSKLKTDKLPLVRGKQRMGCPVAGTRKFVAIGLNYKEHAAEAGAHAERRRTVRRHHRLYGVCRRQEP